MADTAKKLLENAKKAHKAVEPAAKKKNKKNPVGLAARALDSFAVPISGKCCDVTLKAGGMVVISATASQALKGRKTGGVKTSTQVETFLAEYGMSRALQDAAAALEKVSGAKCPEKCSNKSETPKVGTPKAIHQSVEMSGKPSKNGYAAFKGKGIYSCT